MTEVSWDKSLPIFDIAVSACRLIEAGANIFRMEVPSKDPLTIGSRLAVVDPEGWRIEAEVVPNPTPFPPRARHPGCVEVFLLPVAADPKLKPMAVRGKRVDGGWEPIE